jgi:hypothetical protein
MRIARPTLLGFAIAVLSGCQSPDVGQTCQLDLTVPPEASNADYLELGRAECENLVCIQSPTSPPGSVRRYCSKPCVSNSDCSPGETGLTCRAVVLNEAFITQLFQNDPALAQQFLGPSANAKYCATPLP